jgi:SpoIID/LytB domain protein
MTHPTRVVAALAAAALSLPVPVLAAGSANASGCPAPGGASITDATAAAGSEVVFRGHGSGHGLGLSQYGAQGAARLGCTATQILTTYYAGSQVVTRPTPAEVRLWMLENGTAADVLAETGPVTWRLSGCASACPPVQPAGATWRVALDAAKTGLELWDAVAGTLVWSGGASGSTLTADHSGSVISLETWIGATPYLERRLRWDETRYTFNSAGLDAVQAIRTTAAGSAMEKYLWGLAEVSISWTRDAHEALRAQAVAGRTYALLKLNAGTILYPTPRHQHYTGYAREAEDAGYKDQYGRNYRWREAVDSTAGSVVTMADGSAVDTLYSSSFGGYSEDKRYVWGGGAVSYLRTLDDSVWDKASSNPNRSWARGFTLAELATKLGFSSISTLSVGQRGSTTRLSGVKVTGVRSGVLTTVSMTGWDVKVKLGLLSDGFEIDLLTTPTAAASRT